MMAFWGPGIQYSVLESFEVSLDHYMTSINLGFHLERGSKLTLRGVYLVHIFEPTISENYGWARECTKVWELYSITDMHN